MNAIARTATAIAPATPVIALLLMLLFLLGAAPPAFAGTKLHANGFGEVPAQKIVFDNLDLENAQIVSANKNISRKTVAHTNEERTRNSLVLHVKEGSSTTIDSPYTVRFNDAGYDASGDRVDLLLQCDQITMKPYNGKSTISEGDYIVLRNAATPDNLTVISWALEGQTGKLGMQQDFTVRVLKSGTENLCGYPLLMYTSDLDTVDRTGEEDAFGGDFAESLKLLANYESNSYVTLDTLLKATESNTRFSGTAADETTDRSAVVFTLGKNGGQFRWSGCSCATHIFSAFTRNIDSSADDGGSISPAGSTAVLWRGDESYAITPDEHYQIKDILVDGESVGTPETYTFSEVTDNHTIHATFSPIEYVLSFDLNGHGADTPESQHLTYGSATAEPSEPSEEHYVFEGWYKDREGSEPWNFETDTMPGNDLTLYAKWTPITHTVIFQDSEGEAIDKQTVIDGQDATDPGAPEKEGKTFTGWDTDFTDVRQDLTVTAQYADSPSSSSTDTSSTSDESSSSQNEEDPESSSTNQNDDSEPASASDAGSGSDGGTHSADTSGGTYAKTGNPFMDYWWAFPAAAVAAIGAIVLGVRSRRGNGHR